MRAVGALALLLILAAPLGAQSARKPITQDTYDIWRSAEGTTISADGRWVSYTISPVVGDGEHVFRNTLNGTEWRVPRGWTGRPATSVSTRSRFNLPEPSISSDSRWAAAITYAPKAAYDAVRGSRRRNSEPRPSLAIVRLEDGQVSTVPRVRSFALPSDSPTWLVYHLEPADSAAREPSDSAGRPGAAAAAPGGVARPIADSASSAAREKVTGTPLVIRNLAAGGEDRIADVMEYAVDDAGSWLVYSVSATDSTRDGVYARELASGRVRTLASGPGSYKQIVLDDDATQAAFVSDRDVRDSTATRTFGLYHARLTSGEAARVVDADAFGEDERIADGSRLSFTNNGGALLFGV